MDHYALLGLGRDATGQQIRRAYRRLARQHHPDLGAPSGGTAPFIALTAAYETLTNPLKRARYDRTLRAPAAERASGRRRRSQEGLDSARRRPIGVTDVVARFSPQEVRMALIRWEPVAELNSIQNEMNRLFNTFFDQSASMGRGAAPGGRWIPAMDLVETADHYLLRADLPGLSEQDVTVQLEDRVLTISGERRSEWGQQEQEGYYRLERAFGGFSRSLTLPDGVDPDGVQARFDRGVLEVDIPKPEQKKPRQVEISLGRSRTDAGRTIDGTNATKPHVNGGDPVGAHA